jgi:hypothetical protein
VFKKGKNRDGYLSTVLELGDEARDPFPGPAVGPGRRTANSEGGKVTGQASFAGSIVYLEVLSSRSHLLVRDTGHGISNDTLSVCIYGAKNQAKSSFLTL